MPELGADPPAGLRSLAARASYLHERAELGLPPLFSAGSIAKREYHRAKLEARGALAGILERLVDSSPDEATKLLGDVEWPSNLPLPEWTNIFRAILDSIITNCVTYVPLPEPFAHILQPIADYAVATLLEPPNDASENLRGSLRAAVYERVSTLMLWSLLDDFQLFDAENAGALNPDDLYPTYVYSLCNGRLGDFFEDRPVLARMLSEQMMQWISNTGDLFSRLEADRAAIATLIGTESTELIEIAAIAMGLSDPHSGGNSVALVTFRSGKHVIYKPRSLAVDVAWDDLTQWLNHRGLEVHAPRTLDQGEYGWQTFVQHIPCASHDDLGVYLRRSGQLLALLHSVAACDMHFENIVAHGRWPVVIDAETIFHPYVASQARFPAHAAGVRKLADSVLAVGLLPQWIAMGGEGAPGVGGLNFLRERAVQTVAIVDANTADMRVEVKESTVSAIQNVPLPDNQTVGVNFDLLLEGFAKGFALIQSLKDTLLLPDGPLRRFDNLAARLLLRPTAFYENFRNFASQRDSLGDGVARDLKLSILPEPRGFDSEGAKRVARSEHRALLNLDIPRLALRISGTTITDDDGCVAAIAESGQERVQSRLRGMCREVLNEQLEFSRQALRRAFPVDPVRDIKVQRQATSHRMNPSDAMAEARQIGLNLEQSAFEAEGQLAWITNLPVGNSIRFSHEVSRCGLYDGNGGVGIFFAALWHLTLEPKWKRLARKTLAPLWLHYEDQMAARRRNLGLAEGLGSSIYALSCAGDLLEDDELIELAVAFSTLVDTTSVLADDRFDVLGGTAGALMGLAALKSRRPATDVRDPINLCINHLRLNQIGDGPSLGAWPTLGRAPLAGMSHGVAGIAVAVAKSSADGVNDEMVQSALGYERRLFAKWSDWPDLRARTPGFCPCQWCHGATGVGLARLSLLLNGNDRGDRLKDEVKAAVTINLAAPQLDADHLCCGGFGRVEFLAAAAEALKRPELTSYAWEMASIAVQNSDGLGGYRWMAGSECADVGFFSGASGIGYSLLRLANPNALPSVLSFD